jgi:hypothetical protein
VVLALSVLDTSNMLTGFHSIQFSVCSGIILLATFVPKGSFAFNPKAIEGVRNEQEFEEGSSISSVRKGDIEGGRRERDEPIVAS